MKKVFDNQTVGYALSNTLLYQTMALHTAESHFVQVIFKFENEILPVELVEGKWKKSKVI